MLIFLNVPNVTRVSSREGFFVGPWHILIFLNLQVSTQHKHLIHHTGKSLEAHSEREERMSFCALQRCFKVLREYAFLGLILNLTESNIFPWFPCQWKSCRLTPLRASKWCPLNSPPYCQSSINLQNTFVALLTVVNSCIGLWLWLTFSFKLNQVNYMFLKWKPLCVFDFTNWKVTAVSTTGTAYILVKAIVCNKYLCLCCELVSFCLHLGHIWGIHLKYNTVYRNVSSENHTAPSDWDFPLW